jgi:hypothetical protein
VAWHLDEPLGEEHEVFKLVEVAMI